ncbi:PREDICTED: BTB/POZ domain-containing protein KCTD9-like isoform X1 [Amphimedon queenslandica]|uniref:BTB domain-containing protein n=1 Tax=Amphimedon queenslandica TaxID=400682 RepID=A0A1X7VPE8_AMPQE|nr:PREDICTED: BTB/POZ domain-containing protein KCTD9-like isoform X1 [Amphimedon queenslandica]|eukprot:XP_003383321.1 PREDICTED: BTB/POZ domain-containing protein KCTD9-like isoform X1 [Amphimedon queenslandica]
MAAARVTLYSSMESYRQQRKGKVILVRETLSETLVAASEKLKENVEELRLLTGGVVDDITLLREDDILIAVTSSTESTRATPSSPIILSDLPEDQLPELGPQTDQSHFLLKKCSRLLSPDAPSRHDWVRLNVGGKVFATSRATITSDPSSMLARMFESDWFSATDDSGAYLIDRSPEYFEPLLNFMRHGKLIINEGVNPQGVLEEAKFFNVTKAIQPLETLVKNEEFSLAGHLTRKEFLQMIIGSSSSSVLRCQGINLEGVDLSNLDLRNINFKCANLRYCDFSHSDLTNCVLERADLSYATLNNAVLQCVHMPRVVMEGACLKKCIMDASLGVSTNLEGANLKAATFDNSQMSCVNLRLASLKGACLRSCNLRYAIMAGTDMENCDLRGCDLQHANLRGANLAGVNFADITAPLHMSQTVNVNVSQLISPTENLQQSLDNPLPDGSNDNND